MDYNDLVKYVNEINWKFTQIIMGLALAIIAFSIQTITKGIVYLHIWLMFTSWGFFLVSFIVGLIRLNYILSKATDNAEFFYKAEIKKQTVTRDEKKIKSDHKRTAWLYRIMLSSFLIGLVLFAIFKLINL